MNKVKDNKLGLMALIAMCIGSMVGSGLFDLPQNAAVTSGVGALLIGWLITGFGMLFLVKVFQNLSVRCPELDAGVYAYAKAGLGDYLGFSSAWGYWLSAWIANAGYLIFISASLSMFFPEFGDGTNLYSLVFNSITLWLITYLCICGVELATVINTVATIVKIIPIVIFIGVVVFASDLQLFTSDIWQVSTLGSVTEQVKKSMLIMVWVFIGIEGANVFSARAKSRKDISRATILSFLAVFFLFVAVSILPFGVLPQAKLSALKQPAMGFIMQHIVGSWGGIFISVALIIAVLSSFLTWTMIAAEVPYIAGKKDGLFPKIFVRENKHKSPVGALIITGICQQLYLIMAMYCKAGYLVTALLSAAMILLPYLFSAIYALQLAISGKSYKTGTELGKGRAKDYIVSALAVIYGIWLFYAAGVKSLLFISVLYLVGNILFVWHRKCNKQKIFGKYELIYWLILSLLGVGCIYKLVVGEINLLS